MFHSGIHFLTLAALGELSDRSSFSAARAAASGSVIMLIVSKGRDPNPAPVAAAFVATWAESFQIAGMVKWNSIGVIARCTG